MYKCTIFITLISLAFLFISCQETVIEPKKNERINSLERNSLPERPTIYVYGYVTKDSKPGKFATVELLECDYTVLTQTTANIYGYYEMVICPYGPGDRIVKATFDGIGRESFYYNDESSSNYHVDINIGIIHDCPVK